MIAAIIQARTGSSRLPGKVLADICGVTMLERVVRRVLLAQSIDKIVVATTTSPNDDVIDRACSDIGVFCFRGSDVDVLDRFYQTAVQFDADVVVRISSDCPLIDPEIIDAVVEARKSNDADYASNVTKPSYPDGLDVEAFTLQALRKSWEEDNVPAHREHVTGYMRFGNSFRIAEVVCPDDLSRLRWTVDTENDLQFMRAVIGKLEGRHDFTMNDVLKVLEQNPGLAAMNGGQLLNEGLYKSVLDQASINPPAARPQIKSAAMLERARRVIPGCAQTFSKGYNQYVTGVSPAFLDHGKGCRVWDVDGNEYIDYVQGLLPNILGYAHDEVNAAAQAQYAAGHSFSLPHPLELELAERLIEIIPSAEMVRFGKNGSDATAGAVRAARAFTGRDRVACCGYHGWQDWYIGSTTRNAGVPQAVRDLTHPFPYNDLAKLDETLQAHPGEFAAVIMEPVNFTVPLDGYLDGIKNLAHKHGALLIFDEICSGWHFGLGGAQKRFGVTPDISCFGKAMGNGYPISCVVGRADVMAVFAEIFFSFTFAGEVASMAAALKVIDILESTDALERMTAQGRRLQDGFNTFAKLTGLADRFTCVGYPFWSLMQFRTSDGSAGTLERSLFQQEVVKRGVLALATHNMSAAHDPESVEETLNVYASAFKIVAGYLSDSNPERHLEGAPIESVFKVR